MKMYEEEGKITTLEIEKSKSLPVLFKLKCKWLENCKQTRNNIQLGKINNNKAIVTHLSISYIQKEKVTVSDAYLDHRRHPSQFVPLQLLKNTQVLCKRLRIFSKLLPDVFPLLRCFLSSFLSVISFLCLLTIQNISFWSLK